MIARVLAIVALLATAARADVKVKPAARQHFEAALSAFATKDYDTASKNFEAAYAIDPQPFLVFSWAQSERLASRCDHARELYTRYLTFELTTEQSTAAHEGLVACGPAPKARPIVIAPPPPPPPKLAPPRRDGLDYASLALVGGGATAIGLGLTFLVLSGDSLDHAHGATFLDDHRHYLDEATSRRRFGWTAAGLGTLALAGGITLFVVHAHHGVAVASDGRTITASMRW